MSRAERRAYQRMNKNQDRYAMPVPPAQRARLDKMRARRAEARANRDRSVSPRYLAMMLAGALLVGLIGRSVQWSNGIAAALLTGAVVAVVWIALAVALRLLQRRSAAG
jgi:fatty acid desaturase